MRPSEPIYCLDASALIQLKDVYPGDVFASMWIFVESLVDAGRMFISQMTKDECHDDVLQALTARPNMTRPREEEYDDYFAYVSALQADLQRIGKPLTDPSATVNRGDPFVLALALMIEGRDVTDLQAGASSSCHVVSYDKRRRQGLASVMEVCSYYGLGYVGWPDLLKQESWSC